MHLGGPSDMSPSRIHGLFFESVPSEFLKDTVRAVIRSYRNAQDDCTKFDEGETRDVFSHIRRAHFQTDWRRVARGYAELQAISAENEKGTASHTKIRGATVVLTESAVDSWADVPDRAIFRATYARRPQTAFRGFGMDEPPAVQGAPLYAILAHGPRAAGRITTPHFVFVGFPTPDCTEYVHTISLRHLMDAVLPEFDAVAEPTTIQPDLAPPNLATDDLTLRLKATRKPAKKDE
jgi:hypothetical protein